MNCPDTCLMLGSVLNFVLWPCSESIATIFDIFFMFLFRSYQMMMRSHINLTYSSSSEVANVQGDISLPEIPNIIKNCVVSSWKAETAFQRAWQKQPQKNSEKVPNPPLECPVGS